jgi:GNAT superfamily N-acetyltransferase
MIPYPLTRPNRLRLARVFATVPHVDISIDCAIEDQMGKVYVDSIENPQFYMIEQDQFFCYLAGDLPTETGREFARNIPHGRFLMSGSEGWQEVVSDIFAEQAKPIKRYTYASESLSSNYLKNLASANPNTAHIRQMDAELVSGGIPFLEIGAFDSPGDFTERGIGFCMMRDGNSIGVAYSSLVCSDGIEVSIVVDPEHHRQGIATALSCQLLLWCLDHHLAPHWDAANEESCNLAEKLGYSKQGEYTAYYLK